MALETTFGGAAAGLHLAIYGAVLIVVMLYLPTGLAGLLQRIFPGSRTPAP